MNDFWDQYGGALIGLLFFMVVIAAVVNGIYCLKYWNAPWSQTPLHCMAR